VTLFNVSIRSNHVEDRHVVNYCHPYEINPSEMNDYSGKVSPLYRFHQSVGRDSLIRRMRRLLAEYPFGRFDDVINGWLSA